MTEKKPIQDRFTDGLSELIGMCMDGGMHSSDFIAPLKEALAQVRANSWPSKADDKWNAERGLPPMTEAKVREVLQLEPYEPIPPQREEN